ncbi:MAG: energy-coupling factor transporter ATPase [Lachnospiraceae bacterium]|nr:energy-coupling factor transporter ATPase [Lachnospiraceae bacterium]
MIRTEHVRYEYERLDENGDPAGVMTALDDVSFSVSEGEYIAILGRNGSGKSTLAKHINALLCPTGGTVWVLGMDTAKEENLWPVREAAGMVFQNPDNQIIATVVEEDVGFGPENIGVPTDEIWKRVAESLEAVGMTAFADVSPMRLSGGQKQRVAIAGILAMRPDIMLFDEATAMLDPRGRKEVFETVRELNREGMTVVWITHVMEEAAQCETVHIMHDGGLVLSGTPQEVFSDRERLQNWRLDVPPMAALAQRLRAAGVGLPEGILSIDDMTREVEALAAHL